MSPWVRGRWLTPAFPAGGQFRFPLCTDLGPIAAMFTNWCDLISAVINLCSPWFLVRYGFAAGTDFPVLAACYKETWVNYSHFPLEIVSSPTLVAPGVTIKHLLKGLLTKALQLIIPNWCFKSLPSQCPGGHALHV